MPKHSTKNKNRVYSRSMSAAARIYHELKDDIVNMRRLPGERIIERDIAQKHGMSRTPVHEAVKKLAEEGLIDIRPRSGTFVSLIPVDRLEEANMIRSALELTVIRKAALKLKVEDIGQLEKILDDQENFVNAGNKTGFYETDEAFHATIAIAAGYPGIWKIILQAKVQMDRFRHITLQMPGRMKKVLEEHRNILRAIATADPLKAHEVMSSHLDFVLPDLDKIRQLQPDFFINDLK